MTKDSKIQVDPGAYRAWARERQSEMEPVFRPGANWTVKSLLFLALLEHQDESCDYELLQKTIKEKAKAAHLTRDSLRVAVRALIETLEKIRTPYRLTRSANGVFRLDKGRPSDHGSVTHPTTPMIDLALDHPLGQQQRLVDNLMSKRVVPPYSLFYLPRSAALWSAEFAVPSAKRSRDEAGAWELYDIRSRLEPQLNPGEVICVVGLAVGEGHAELALLGNILKDDTVVVHYLALDISPTLLVNHMQHLYLEYSDELKNGRLVCAAVMTDIFDMLRENEKLSTKWDAIWRARKKMEEMELLDFLPRERPKIVTYFGGVLGNEQQNSESRFFELLRTRLGDNYRESDGADSGELGSLHCIIGVAMFPESQSPPAPEGEQKRIEEANKKYGYRYKDFFLTGPRQLAKRSFLGYDERNGRKPFPDPEDISELEDEVKRAESEKKFREEVKSRVTCVPTDFSGSFKLEGRRNAFNCTLGCEVWSKENQENQRFSLNKGSQVELCAIVEYKMATMKNFVKQMGFNMVEPDKEKAEHLEREDCSVKDLWIDLRLSRDRHYGIFCVELAD